MNKKKTKRIWIASGTTFGLLGTTAIIGFPIAYLLPHSNESNDNLTNLINQVTVTKTPLTFVPTNLISGAAQNVSGVGMPSQNEFNVVLPKDLPASDVSGYKILPISNNNNTSTTQMQIELTFSNNATKTFTLSNLSSYANISLLFNTIAVKIKTGINVNSLEWQQFLNLSNTGNKIMNTPSNTKLLNSIFDFYFPAGLNISFIQGFILTLPSSTNSNYVLQLSSLFYGNNTLTQNINFSFNNITEPNDFTMSLASNANISAPAVSNLITSFSSTLNSNAYAINDFVFSNLPSGITSSDMLGFTVLDSNINTGVSTLNLYFNSQNAIFPFLNVNVNFTSISDYIANSSKSISVNVLPTGSTPQIPNVALPFVSTNPVDVPNSMNFTFTNNSIITASDITQYIVNSVDATTGSIVATFIVSNKNWTATSLKVENVTITGYIDSFQNELNSITIKANVNSKENILSKGISVLGSDLNNYTFAFTNSSNTASKLITQSNVTSFIVISNDIINGSIIANISVKDTTTGIIYLIPNVTITGFFQYSHYISNLSFYLINQSNDFPTKVGQNIPINNILFQPMNNNAFFNNSNISSIAVSSIDNTNKTLKVLVTFQFQINNQSTYTTVQYPDTFTFNWNILS